MKIHSYCHVLLYSKTRLFVYHFLQHSQSFLAAFTIISCSIHNHFLQNSQCPHNVLARVVWFYLNNFNTLTFAVDHAMLCLNPSRYPWLPLCSRIRCQTLRSFRSKPVSFTVADYIIFGFFRRPA
jgi:hypothetical protein